MATTQPGTRPVLAHPRAGLALICVAGVVWGTIGPAVDVAHERSGLSILTLGAYRGVAAVVTLAAAVLVTRRSAELRALVRDHPRRVLAVGALTAAFQVLFFVAVVAVGVSVATVVTLGFAPVLLLVVGSVRRRRPPGAAALLTVGTAVVGLLLVSLGGSGADAGGSVSGATAALGVLAALGSGSAFALSAEFGVPLSQRFDGVTIAAATTGIAAVVLMLGGVIGAVAADAPLATTDAASWGLIAYLGVVTMAFAYVLLFVALRTTPSGSVVIATLIEPVTAVVIAVLLLGERLTVAGGIGALLILAAISSLGRQVDEPPPQ